MSFGIDTDVLGLTAHGTHGTGWKLQGPFSHDPSPSEATAEDSNGDVAAATMYDTANITRSATYVRVKDSTIALYDTTTAIDFRVGAVKSGYVITGLSLATSNTERPKLTITTQKTAETDGNVNKYNVTELHVSGSRKATAKGFTVAANNKLNSSTLAVTGQVARELDSQGAEVTADVYGAQFEGQGDFVGVSADPSATADTGYRVVAGPSYSKENTGYATGSITVRKSLTQM